MESIHISACR